MDRNRTKAGGVAARAGNRQNRSDSRKRNRRSESPETEGEKGKDKDKITKKLKKVGEKDQTKITQFKQTIRVETSPSEAPLSKMATNDKQFESLMAELQRLNMKMDGIDKKLDERVMKLEGKVFDIEQAQDTTKKDIETVKKKVELCEELSASVEHTANLALTQAERQEQYMRNYNIRIFNVPENENETIEECERKVLALFEEKLQMKIPIESIDMLHRLGPKRRSTKEHKSELNKEKDQQKSDDIAAQSQKNESQTESDNRNKDKINNDNTEENMITEHSNEAEMKQDDKKVNNDRPIIISFISRRIRRAVLANRHLLKKRAGQTSAPIIIVEDLIKKKHALLSKAKENKSKYKNVWSKDGVILAKQHNDAIVRIESFADISSPPVDAYTQQHTHARRGRGFHYTRVLRGGQGRGRGFHRLSYRDVSAPYFDRGLTVSNRFDGIHPDDLDLTEGPTEWN